MRTEAAIAGDYVNQELDDISERLEDVLAFRLYQSKEKGLPTYQRPALDRIAQTELSISDWEHYFEADEELLGRTILHSYNTAVEKLEEIDPMIDDCEEIEEDGAVTMFTSTKPKLASGYSTARSPTNDFERGDDIRPRYSELTGKAALIGDYLERLTVETDNCCIDRHNIASFPEAWRNQI